MNARNEIFDDTIDTENPNPVYVVFTNDEETWRRVVEEADESVSVLADDSVCFLVKYETAEDFTQALARFEGTIVYDLHQVDPRANSAARMKP